MYKLSRKKWMAMKIMYWAMVADIVLSLVLITYAQETDNQALLDFMYNSNVFTGIFFLLYFGLSIWTVYLFCRKIYLIGLSTASPREQSMTSPTGAQVVALSDQQTRYVRLGSKFVSLFVIASIWMVLTFGIILPAGITSGVLFSIAVCIDGFVNLLTYVLPGLSLVNLFRFYLH